MPSMISVMSYCSSSRHTTGWRQLGSISVLLASARWATFRANSITAHCKPKQMPKNATREQTQAEGVATYKLFIATLLDLTDNLDLVTGEGTVGLIPANYIAPAMC